jgi:2-furoate---CoA ligase
MLDLGTSWIASVSRDPAAIAVVDGDVRLTYLAWHRHITSVVAGFDAIGLERGDHILTLLQNRWQAATIHWACQLAGLVLTPLNWRATASDIAFAIADCNPKTLIYETASAAAVTDATTPDSLPRISLQKPARGEIWFNDLLTSPDDAISPRAGPDALSLMLYTSGTTSRPKGVPRRHRAERAAAIAHIAQNLYARGECTLGVMPLYHTMGVRSLLAMSLIGGRFVCLPRWDVPQALTLIERERVSNLYLVPTLYHDLISHPEFPDFDRGSVRKLGFAGAPMTDGLLARLDAAFRPLLFVNHYGSSEIYTCTVNQRAAEKPGSAGRAGLNQLIRVVKLGTLDPADLAAPDQEGEIIALLAGDEAFSGYWRRPDADARALREGWYFTGDTGRFDTDGDLFVTGRVDDMIITGGENVSPIEVESCLSLHPSVREVAVAGLPDERWGKVVTAFITPSAPVSLADLENFVRRSGLAQFKRPRRFIFVDEIPKSPVGKLLRRKLVDGDYQLARMDT